MKILKFLNLPTVNKDVASLIIKRVMQSDIEDLAMLRCTDKTTKKIIDDLLNSSVGAKMVIDEFARLAGEPSALPIDIDPQQRQFDPKLFYKLKDFCLWAGFTKNWRNLDNDSSIIAYALTTQHPTEFVTNRELFAKLVNALRNPNIPLITKDMVARQLKILCAASIPVSKEPNSANLIKERILAEEKHPEYLKARYKNILNRYRDHLIQKKIKFSESVLHEMTIKFLRRKLQETDANSPKKIQALKDLLNFAQKAKSLTQKLSLTSVSHALRFQNRFNEVIAELNEDDRFTDLESQLTHYSLANNAFQDSDDALPIANDLSRDHYCMTHLPLNYLISSVINARFNMYLALNTKYQSQWPWCNLENIDFDYYYHIVDPLRINNLQYADLRGANFVKSNLQRNLRLPLNVDMKGSRLTRANLQQTILNSNLDAAILDQTLLYGSRIVTQSEADFSRAEGVSMRVQAGMNNKKLSTSQRYRLFMEKYGRKINLSFGIPVLCFYLTVAIILTINALFTIPALVAFITLAESYFLAHRLLFDVVSISVALISIVFSVSLFTELYISGTRSKKNITPTAIPDHNQEQRPDMDLQRRDILDSEHQQTATDNPHDLTQFAEFNLEKIAVPTVQSETHLKAEAKRPLDLAASLFATSQGDEAEKSDQTKVKASTEQQPDFRTDVEKSSDTSSSQSLFSNI